MREISPHQYLSAASYVSQQPLAVQLFIAQIQSQKRAGTRRLPSSTLVDESRLLSSQQRTALIDKVASLVDENCSGRSDMCGQFAVLLARALTRLGFAATVAHGRATYFRNQREVFSWLHSWVTVGDEVIDGNVDSTVENPEVPKSLRIQPYWGPGDSLPADRKLDAKPNMQIPADSDVDRIWWPDLEAWLRAEFESEQSNAQT